MTWTCTIPLGARAKNYSGFSTQGPPAMLGLYANLLTRRSALSIISRARASGWKVIAGGPSRPTTRKNILAAGADYVVPGEGEIVMERLLAGEHAPDGVVYRDERTGVVVRTPAAPQIPDLDSLPWPDRERIDIHRYLARVARAARRGVGFTDHRARVPIFVPLVQPFDLRPDTSATLPERRGRRSRMDPRSIRPGDAVVRRRRVHDSSAVGR